MLKGVITDFYIGRRSLSLIAEEDWIDFDIKAIEGVSKEGLAHVRIYYDGNGKSVPKHKKGDVWHIDLTEKRELIRFSDKPESLGRPPRRMILRVE